jgi:flagellar hook protein FlgE
MSINSALNAAVSGLVSTSSALSAISQNIANANTVGYKQQTTQFEDLVGASSSAGNYAAGGVQANVQQLVSQNGTPTQTTSGTDLSISGNGMFVVTGTPTPTNSDPRSYTEAGSFTVDSNGDLVNAAGYYLQGFPVNADGSVTVNPSDLNTLQTINVAAIGGTATATTSVTVNQNLNSTQNVNTAAAAAYSATSNSMAAYEAGGTGTVPDATITIPITNTQGGQETLEVYLEKSTTANTWNAEVVAPGGGIQYGPDSTLNDNQLATGTLVFNSNGTLDLANSTLFGGSTSPTLDIGASASTPTGSGYAWGTSLGVGAQNVALNLDTSPGGITQYDSATLTQSIDANGTAFGNLNTVAIDSNGFVTATYSNGISKQIAQVAIATFANPDGLTQVNGDAYQVSTTSGSFNLKTPGSAGAGTISPDTLESSTVDLSSEFANLITTQQAYSASAKVITTADQMEQALIATIQ